MPVMKKDLRNAAGQVIGRTERDVASETVTAFWYPRGLQRTMASQPSSRPGAEAAALPRPTVYQELADMATAYFTRRAQAAPPVERGAYWPGVPAGPATLDRVIQRQQEQGVRA
jgi:hypothetical protein